MMRSLNYRGMSRRSGPWPVSVAATIVALCAIPFFGLPTAAHCASTPKGSTAVPPSTFKPTCDDPTETTRAIRTLSSYREITGFGRDVAPHHHHVNKVVVLHLGRGPQRREGKVEHR